MGWTTKPEFDAATAINQIWQANQALPLTAEELATGEKVVLTTIEDGVIKQTAIKEYKNKVPTHDPYTNPDSHIYYECSCGAILDPGTRSFAQLNNVASAKNWKVRWRKDGQGYEAFCVECGKDKE